MNTAHRATGILLLAAAYTCVLMAQSTSASITGLVTDGKGAVVPGAKIEATNVATGYLYTAASNNTGQYTLTGLLNGTYTVRAAASGFANFVAEDIVLTAREQRRIDVELKVGAVQTTVEVSSKSSLIETETARISDVKEHEVIWDSAIWLHRTADVLGMAPMAAFRPGSGYTIGGSRANQSEMSFDGISAASPSGGTLNGVSGDRTEAFQEVRVEAAGSNAEFNTLGQVSIITRSGTNQVHGSAFDYYVAPGWSARDPFSVASTATVSHSPGGSLGGPVVIPKIYNGRNKTFFFAAIEFEDHIGSPLINVWTPSVPLASWRNGDFSKLLPGTVIKDPFAGNAPFPGNIIPASRLNPVSLAIQNRYYPLPNFGDPNVFQAGNYRANTSYLRDAQPTANLRIDHKFSDKAWVNGRTTQVYWDTSVPAGTLPTFGILDRRRFSKVYGLGLTYMITPTLTSESRYGFAFDSTPIYAPVTGMQQVQELGLKGLAPDIPAALRGTYSMAFTGLGLAGISITPASGDPRSYNPVHSGQQSLSWFHGRHSIKAGFQIRRNGSESYVVPGSLFGNDTFSNRFTGHPYADFLLGIPSTAARDFPPLKTSTMENGYGLYLQDDLRLTPKLTLAYGLRWDYLAPWSEANNYLSVFDPKTGAIVVPDAALSKVSPLLPANYIRVIGASKAGYPDNLVNGYKKAFSPRFGAAWRPFGNNFVFRGGFGMYYNNYVNTPSVAGVPFTITEPAFTNPANNPALVLPQVFPSTGTGGPATVSIPFAINPNLRLPYSLQYNASIERQFGNTAISLFFVSTAGRQTVYSSDLNQPVASTTLYINKPRPFPNYPAINYLSNGGGHQYRAATIQVKRSFTGGLWFQAYYTLSRDIGDVDSGGAIEDAYNRRREVGVSSDPPTHRFYTNLIYELPVGKGKQFLPNAGRVLNAAIGGWQVANIFVYESGFFLTPTWSGPDPTNTRFTTSSTPPVVTLRPNIVSDPNLADPTVARWFNPAAFAPPSPGAFGTSARGVIIGPPLNMWNTSIKKYFTVQERLRFRIELLAINTFNHVGYLANPVLNISSAGTAGTITGTQLREGGQPRQMQINLRLEW